MRKILLILLFLLITSNCYALTDFTITVIPAGGGDYTALNTAVDTIACDLTVSTTVVIAGSLTRGTIADGVEVTQSVSASTGTCEHHTATQMLLTGVVGTPNATGTWYPTADGNDTTNAWTPTDAGDSASVIINCSGSTADTTVASFTTPWKTNTNNTNKITINGDNTTGKWNTNAYRLIITNGSCISFGSMGGTAEIVLNNLQGSVKSTTTSGRQCIAGSSTTGTIKLYVNNCIFTMDSTGDLTGQYVGINSDDTDYTMYVKNSMFYNFKSTAVNSTALRSSSNHTWYAYDNTIFNCDTGTVSSGTNFRLINNIINNCTADTSGSYNAVSTNNLTDITPGATNAIGATADSGTTDSATSGKLNDSDQNFLTTVKVGMIIKNTTDTTYTYVTAVDSDGVLSVNDDIFANAEAYTIYSQFYGTPTFVSETAGSEDLHLQSIDTAAIDKWSNVYGDASLPVITDIDNDDRPNSTNGDIGADEYTASGSSTAPPFHSIINVEQ